MLHQISITYGTRKVLSEIIAANPDRLMKLYAGSSPTEDLALLDLSDEPPVFQAATVYEVKAHAGSEDFNGILNLQFLTLSDEDQQIADSRMAKAFNRDELISSQNAAYLIEAVKNTSRQALLTLWNDPNEIPAWKKSPLFEPITHYLDGLHDYHEVTYRPVH